MKSFFYFLFVFVLIILVNTKTYCQVRFFCNASAGVNVSTRDLNPIDGNLTEATEIFLKKRRKAERPALRESVFFGIGVAFTTKATLRTGITYKNLGDREKVEILTFQTSPVLYDYREYIAKHSFKYISFPLAFSYKIYNTKKFNLNLSVFSSYSILLSKNFKLPDMEDKQIVGYYNNYQKSFTKTNQNPITIGFGVFTEKKLNENLALELGIKGGYHINTSFSRNETYKHNLLFVGLNAGLVKYF